MGKQKSKKNSPVKKDPQKQVAQIVKKENQWKAVLPLVGILLFTLLVYLKSLNNGFTNYDDDVLIRDNVLVQNLTADNLYNIFFSFINGMYHPLTTLSWALEFNFFGEGAFHYHLINLIFHLLNVWLVYRLMLMLTKKLNIAVIAGLIFAVHPMISESVLWLSERKDLLCYAFMLGGLIHYVKYLKNDLRFKYIMLTFIFMFFALLSKPSAIVFPMLLMVIDYYYQRKISVKSLLEKLPFFAFAISFGIIAILAARSVEGINTLKAYSALDRVFFTFHAIMFYLYKLIIPVGLTAKHFYPSMLNGMLPVQFYVSLIVAIIVIVAIVKYGKKNRVLISGLLFYLACISVVLPIVPVGDTVVAERYSYFSYIGLLLIIGHLYNQYRETIVLKLKASTLMNIVLTLFIIFFSFTTFSRSEIWKDSETLWTDVIAKNPGADLAYVARGDAKLEKGDYEEASKDYTMAVIIDSTNAFAYSNRGYVFIKTEKYDKAQLDLDRAVRLQPKFAEAYYNRSCLYIETKKYKDAMADCDKVLELSPSFAYAYYNRGNANYNLGNHEKAIEDFDQAISLDSTKDVFFYFRGLAYFSLEFFNAAQIDFNKAYKLNKNNTDALLYRARSLYKAQNYSAAITDLDELIKQKPDEATYRYYRGNAKYYNGDYIGALQDFNALLNGSADFAPAYYGRALVYMSSDSLEQACSDFNKANELGYDIDPALLAKTCK